MAESIRTFGFNVPVLVGSNLNIIVGHARTDAAKLLKPATVPVIPLTHLTGGNFYFLQLPKEKSVTHFTSSMAETSSWFVCLGVIVR